VRTNTDFRERCKAELITRLRVARVVWPSRLRLHVVTRGVRAAYEVQSASADYSFDHDRTLCFTWLIYSAEPLPYSSKTAKRIIERIITSHFLEGILDAGLRAKHHTVLIGPVGVDYIYAGLTSVQVWRRT
jgi:hypothetical protein